MKLKWDFGMKMRILWTDTESEPFEGEAETPESPHIVAPSTCHDEESEGSDTSGLRSTSSDSTAPLSSDHPLIHTTPALVLILRRTVRMAVCVPPAMSPGLSASRAKVAAMSDLAFHKRFRSPYDSSPSPTLPVWKRYRGTSELILDTDSEEDEEAEESLDYDMSSDTALQRELQEMRGRVTTLELERDRMERRREERLLINTAFLDEYECSSLALDREERREEEDKIRSLETRSKDCIMVMKEIVSRLLEEEEDEECDGGSKVREFDDLNNGKGSITWQSMVWMKKDAKDGLAKQGNDNIRM
nr:hypothetical protein [Tanacetum cinerariifolium]